MLSIWFLLVAAAVVVQTAVAVAVARAVY